jgi:oxygen-independent coproporphyrinogen-3 oxidase
MRATSAQRLQGVDTSGPRYTAYPTADRFVDAFTTEDYARALRHRSHGQASLHALSLYVHIPFCESLCYYCACNKVITRHHAHSAIYLDYLTREVQLQVAALGSGQSVSQLHLGGGTPTFFSDDELGRLMTELRQHFRLVPGGEYSVEVDPRTVDSDRLQTLACLGFNRLSFGLQDFDSEVQKAIHRVQPAERVFAQVQEARRIGFESVNVDLIYGLPKQTHDTFARTLAQVSSLRPDRVALYAYDHLPDRFKAQRRILTCQLPSPSARADMLALALSALEDAGYVYVGMDQLALPQDALTVSRRQGRLHRNFLGYSTQPDCDLIALGVSAIGRVGATYSQNARTMDDYCDLIDQSRLPVTRGLALGRDDLTRRAVIMALMCQGQVFFESIELAWLLDFRRYFAAEMVQLEALQARGLVAIDTQGVQVTVQGRYCVRSVAMVFDRYLQADRDRAQFSQII